MLLRSSEVQAEISNGERVDPRITRSRQMIEQAFLELFFQRGLEAITVRDITQRAGVNRATFYAHFEDKYALFTHIIEKRLDALIQTRLPKDATFTPDNLRLLVLALIDFFASGNDSDCTSSSLQPMRPIVESRAQEQIATLLHGWLHATPNARVRASVAMTATVVSWALFGLSLSYVRSGKQHIEETEIAQAIGIILHGAIEQTEEHFEDSLSNNFRNTNPTKMLVQDKRSHLSPSRQSPQGAIAT